MMSPSLLAPADNLIQGPWRPDRMMSCLLPRSSALACALICGGAFVWSVFLFSASRLLMSWWISLHVVFYLHLSVLEDEAWKRPRRIQIGHFGLDHIIYSRSCCHVVEGLCAPGCLWGHSICQHWSFFLTSAKWPICDLLPTFHAIVWQEQQNGVLTSEGEI